MGTVSLGATPTRGLALRHVRHLDEVLELARHHLGMELAFVSEVAQGRQTFRAANGDGESFGISAGQHVPLTDTYCKLLLDGRLDNAVPDVPAHPLLRRLSSTLARRIGAYIAVPLRLRNGQTYGTLCCLAHQSKALTERDVQFLRLLADMLVDDLEADHETEHMRQQIQTLLDGELFTTAFQPIVELGCNGCVGFEALTRFPAGYGPPDQVFDMAHAVGLGSDLEAAAIRRAMRVLPRLGADHYLSVNIAPDALIVLAADANDTDEDYRRVVVEITEHCAVADYGELRESLHVLRSKGIRLAVDDAGSGWASLRHIIELAPDIIKLDRSLVHDLAEDHSRRSVVRAFVTVAHDMHATVVAEGVETQEELDAARSLGVQAAQGYLIARPDTSLDVLHLHINGAEGACQAWMS